MAQFDKMHTSFYYLSMLTMFLSCIVSKIQ